MPTPDPRHLLPADADRQTALLARFGRDTRTTTDPRASARRKETT